MSTKPTNWLPKEVPPKGESLAVHSEVWSPVQGYEGIYEVSNQGRIRSLGRVVETRKGHKLRVHPRILKYRFSGSGNATVALCREGEEETRLVHRLVADAFWGPLDPEDCVHHKNGDSTDNRLSNLYIAALVGEETASARLSEDEIIAIRALEGVLPQKKLGAIFGVSGAAISMIQSHGTWRHV